MDYNQRITHQNIVINTQITTTTITIITIIRKIRKIRKITITILKKLVQVHLAIVVK
jgi:hypothetical protein